MIIAIVILGLLIAAETLFIFWLLGVLKNTLDTVSGMADYVQGKIPRNLREAYDGKYYPATVLAQIKFESPQEMAITDFSLYETKKIVGFTIYTKETAAQYYGSAIEDFDEDDLELLSRPAVFKNAIVYAPREGMWAWKSAE